MIKRIVCLALLICCFQSVSYAECNSVTAYLAVPADQILDGGRKALLKQDSWTAPTGDSEEDREGKERIMKVISWPECPLNDGRIIVKVDFPTYFVDRLVNYCTKRGVANPMSQQGLITLDIIGSWIGKTREACIAKYPELDGVDTDGRLIFPLKKWSFEA